MGSAESSVQEFQLDEEDVAEAELCFSPRHQEECDEDNTEALQRMEGSQQRRVAGEKKVVERGKYLIRGS